MGFTHSLRPLVFCTTLGLLFGLWVLFESPFQTKSGSFLWHSTNLLEKYGVNLGKLDNLREYLALKNTKAFLVMKSKREFSSQG